jgi:hypothetical protein
MKAILINGRKLMQPNRDLYRAAAKAVNHRFFLVDVIENVDDYLDLLEALADATEEDTIDIHINSPGGDLAIVAQIVHHMTRTKGLVITHAEGEVCSGGSLIFFSGHQLDVGDFSEFLFGEEMAFELMASNEASYYDPLKINVRAFSLEPDEIYNARIRNEKIKKLIRAKNHSETVTKQQANKAKEE